MKLSVPNMLTDSGIVSVACGRSQRAGATEDGKLIFWEVNSIPYELSFQILGTTQ